MVMPRLCKFYKDAESLDTHQGISFCDLDSDQTTCTGDIDSCPRTDSLKRYFFEQIRREGGWEWEANRSAIPEDPKARAWARELVARTSARPARGDEKN